MSKITNKLLREAIADAEAVRETAIANAKLVLEESITPQVKEMIARRLRVEAEMMDDDGDEMDEAVEMAHEDGEAEGSVDSPADTSTVGTGENKHPSDAASNKSGIGDGGENVEDGSTDWYDDWDESDFDLAEVIKELENDIAALDRDKTMTEDDDMDDTDMDDDDTMSESDDEELDLEEILSELDTMDDDMVDEGDESMDDEEEIDLEELLSELEHEDDVEEDDEDAALMQQEIVGLRTELAESRYAVNILRGHLKEVNLLNAKLLFTNKMFKKEGLNNDQKVRIVESFDRATTLREVKLVYAALVENMSVVSNTNKPSRKKIVTEGFASKATPSTAPKRETIVENTVARRLQELAGILN
jgi:hypothetical protein